MARTTIRPLLWLAAAIVLLVGAGSAGATGNGARSVSTAKAGTSSRACLAHVAHAKKYYTYNCTGHDEPELDPVSSAPHSALNVSWRIQLPQDGATTVTSVGPTFWFGGAVKDSNPDKLGGQGFLELQFYGDSRLSLCDEQGGFFVTKEPGTFTACSPVWSLELEGEDIAEPAAFNGMLTNASGTGPFVMHARDVVDVHIWAPSINDAYREQLTDETTHQTSSVLVLISKEDGPLTPISDTNEIGHSLDWGIVWDTPMSFVYEIGHSDIYGPTQGAFCLPGQDQCGSFNGPNWTGQRSPLRIFDVTFGDGSHPQHWATVSDTGGKAEVLGQSWVGETPCKSYGGPYCIYPWFSWDGEAFNYGASFPNTVNNFHGAEQFAQQPTCPPDGLFDGPTYCATIIK